MNVFQERLIQNIRYYRKVRNMTQKELAKVCALSPGFIGDVEMGRKFPSSETLTKLAFALRIQPEVLFSNLEDIEASTDYQRYISVYTSQLTESLIGYINETLCEYMKKEPNETDNKNDNSAF